MKEGQAVSQSLALMSANDERRGSEIEHASWEARRGSKDLETFQPDPSCLTRSVGRSPVKTRVLIILYTRASSAWKRG